MADFARFKRGAKTYPLPTGTGRSALQDADPFVFFALEFLAKVIEVNVGDRLMEASVYAKAIEKPVAMKTSIDPIPVLRSAHWKFPLLAIYRDGGKLEDRTMAWRGDESTFDVVYVLPPLSAAHAVQLTPLLIAIRDVIDERVSLGHDPAFAPTGGEDDETVWVKFAGAEIVRMTEYEVGAWEGPAADLLFYALRMRGQVRERSDLAEGALQPFEGADVGVALYDTPTQTATDDFVSVATGPEPTLTNATPNAGTKQGGTTVTLTGANFVVGTTPTIRFGGVSATDVEVLSSTAVRCKTPAHTAFGSLLVDVDLVALDGQSATLIAGFTFTSP